MRMVVAETRVVAVEMEKYDQILYDHPKIESTLLADGSDVVKGDS